MQITHRLRYLALGAALHAFGAHLSLAALLIAVTTAGVLASASPAGGGMAVAEAGLILALTAGGIFKGDATAAVFVQRLFSAYLPTHCRLVHPHVDAQEGIPMTCSSQRHAGPCRTPQY